MNKPVILFDGFCNLCTFSTRLILKLDHKKQFRYIPLQSPEGEKILQDLEKIPDTVILYFNHKLFFKSNAVLKTASLLGFPASVISIFYIIPKVVRDFLYDIIAHYRYKIFGKKEYCRTMPGNEKRKPSLWSPLKDSEN
jgi:predicted DCC family thiol-disulfide oxidoreductase YuxK